MMSNWAQSDEQLFIKFTNSVWMIADQNFYHTCFTIFYPTASATVYGRRPKFFRAEHSATAEGENCAYGPTLAKWDVCKMDYRWSATLSQ